MTTKLQYSGILLPLAIWMWTLNHLFLLEAAFLALFSCESLDPLSRSIFSGIEEDESLLCISRNTHKGRILRHTLFFDEFPLSRLLFEIMFGRKMSLE